MRLYFFKKCEHCKNFWCLKKTFLIFGVTVLLFHINPELPTNYTNITTCVYVCTTH